MISALVLPRWRYLLLLLGVNCLASWKVVGATEPERDEGQPFLQSFSPRDYHANTQCWSAVQDARGVMYVGNYAVVLEYDGSSWRHVPIPTNGWVSALAYEAATDTVFVGGESTLGYLKLAPGGERVFVSLLDQLPADARNVGNVRSVYATPAGIFFLHDDQVMRWRGGQFKTWQSGGSKRVRGGWAAGRFYIHRSDLGLRRLEGDAFASASADPILSRVSTRGVFSLASGDLLIATPHDGLFHVHDGAVKPWEMVLNGYLKEKGIYDSLLLRDGSLAVATETAGLVILDKEGRFRSHVDNAGGLHGNNILCMYEDAEGGLWIGLESGITRAEIDSPLSILRAGTGDNLSNVQCGGLCAGTMILGTLNGAYRLVPADPGTATGARLERLPGITDEFFSAAAVENGLLLAAAGKVVLLDRDARITPVFTTPSVAEHLRSSRLHPGRVLVGEETGPVTALQLDAATQRWVNAGVVAQRDKPGVDYGITESARGDLWVGSKEQGLFHAPPSSGGGPAVMKSLLEEAGPLRGEPSVWIFEDGGPTIFRTPHKLYTLDESGQNVRLAPEYGARFVDGSHVIESAFSYDARSLWITASPTDDVLGTQVYGQAVVGGPGLPPTFRQLPRKIEEVLGHVEGFFAPSTAPEKLTTLLLMGTNGEVVRLDVPRWEALAAPGPFATLIRRAVTTNHETVGGTGSPILQAPLPFARNSAHFEYSANTFAFGAAPRFQTRLANFEEGRWSDFTDRTSVDYTNLPEGSYAFEVRARDADGRPGRVAALSFRILPPWQRTLWAYAAYALATAFGVAAFAQWRGHQLRRRNAVLEGLVETRTSRLQEREAELLANERELVRARDAAESANRAKSAFLANMTHELRTPLNAILGYSQVLLKDPELSPRNRERVTTMDRSGNHLLSMINEVLDLSKIEAGKLTLLPTHFSLEALLDDLCAAFRPRFAEKQIAFENVRGPGLPTIIHTDAGKLRQVLFNLLGNALKFTDRGAVRLEVTPTASDAVRFGVKDTGIGIETEELRNIFLAFHQTGDHRAATQGTGLGLSISQRLVELLGGHLQVESTPGQGTRFWFELPLAPVQAAGDVLTLGSGEAARHPVVGYQGPRRRLLIVDDEAVNRRVLCELLAPLGFEIEEAAGGEECLRRCAERLPDALLLDLRMGSLGGLEVARTLRLRGGTGGAAIRIVAVSASVFEDDRQGAIEAGCDDFLPKPFKEEQLLSVLGRLLDLEWVHAETKAADHAAGPAADGTQFAHEIDALIELAHRGDILGLKTRFAALRNSGGIPKEHRAFAGQLEPLLAGYEVDRVHRLLVDFKEHANP